MGLLSLTIPPAVDAVDLTLAKKQIVQDPSIADDDDDLLGVYIGAVVAVAEEKLGKSLITQTWAESFRNPVRLVRLSKRPVQSVVSVTYYDTDNVQQTLNTGSYALVAQEDWAYIEMDSLPALADRADSLTVNYVVGFGDTAADIPKNILQAMLLLFGQYDLHRENVVRFAIESSRFSIASTPSISDNVLRNARAATLASPYFFRKSSVETEAAAAAAVYSLTASSKSVI